MFPGEDGLQNIVNSCLDIELYSPVREDESRDWQTLAPMHYSVLRGAQPGQGSY